MADAFGVDFRKRFINHPTLKRTVEIVAVEINAGHGLHPSQSFEVQNERAAYQSDADKVIKRIDLVAMPVRLAPKFKP